MVTLNPEPEYPIPEPLINKIVGYLVKRPYEEVAPLIQELYAAVSRNTVVTTTTTQPALNANDAK